MNKYRHTFVLVAVTLLVLLPLAALAAPGSDRDRDRDRGRGHGHGPGRGMFPPPGYLDLSEEQIEAAREIRESVRAEMEASREATAALREELKAALDGGDPDAAAVGEMVIELHGLREQTRAIFEDAESQFAAILTAEQLEKWENFKELRRNRRGPRRGGPIGGGFGDGPERPGPVG